MAEAIKLLIVVKKSKQDYKSVVQLAPEYAKIIESVHGKNSSEFIDAKKELANSYLLMNNSNLSYKECLEAYELAKNLYGSDKNADWVDILSFMAIIKMRLHQFEEAKNFLTKCKEIEEQLSSKFSQRYKSIVNLESNLSNAESQANNQKKGKGKKTSFLSKIAPNTPTKFAIYLTAIAAATIGVVYYIKKKHRD